MAEEETGNVTTILVKIEGLRKDVGHIKDHIENHTPQIYKNKDAIFMLESKVSTEILCPYKDDISSIKIKQRITTWLGGTFVVSVIAGVVKYITKHS